LVNWRAGVLLLAVLLALGVYAYQSRPKPPSAPRGAGIVPCDASNTLDLELSGTGGTTLHLQRAGTEASAEWSVVKPSPGPAAGSAVARLLTGLHEAVPSSTLDRPGGLAGYGLETPALVMTCRVSGGRSYTLSIGDKSFDGSGYYVRLSDQNKVFVLSAAEVDQLLQALAKPPYRPSPSPSGAPGPSPSP
jgi:hypothetical protein